MEDKDLNIIKELLLKPIMEQLAEIKEDISRLYEISEKFGKIDREIEKIIGEQKLNNVNNDNRFEEIERQIASLAKRVGELEERPQKNLKIWHLVVAIITSIIALILSILRIFHL